MVLTLSVSHLSVHGQTVTVSVWLISAIGWLGAARYAGVPRLRAVSEIFESACRNDITAVTPNHFIALRPAYRALIDALDTLQAVELDKVAMDADLAD